MGSASRQEPLAAQPTSPPANTAQTEKAGDTFVPIESTSAVNQPAPECATHQADLQLSASASMLQIGDSLTLTATLTSAGCAMIGLQKYSLILDADAEDSHLLPAEPEPVIHSIGLRDGEQDEVFFTLQAVTPGEVELQATASFEVHLGYPGPAYWSSVTSQPVRIRITE